MTTTARRLTLAAAAPITAAAILLPGCVIAIGDDTIYPDSTFSYVSRSEYKDALDAITGLTVGDERALVLSGFEDEMVSLISAKDTATGPVHLYELGAINKSTRSSVSRFLVFYRDRLNTVTDNRADADTAFTVIVSAG